MSSRTPKHVVKVLSAEVDEVLTTRVNLFLESLAEEGHELVTIQFETLLYPPIGNESYPTYMHHAWITYLHRDAGEEHPLHP
ncbi:MAG TPA: hypothetical protein VNZ55_04325 [Thermomicrobiales bacterium]|nr:hypothetical protein [Thermomicrobiales bacterium]